MLRFYLIPYYNSIIKPEIYRIKTLQYLKLSGIKHIYTYYKTVVHYEFMNNN